MDNIFVSVVETLLRFLLASGLLILVYLGRLA